MSVNVRGTRPGGWGPRGARMVTAPLRLVVRFAEVAPKRPDGG
jgi:hypothetical protein